MTKDKELDLAAEGGKGGGNKKMLIIIIAAVLLLGGGAAYYFLMMGGDESAAEEVAEGAAAEVEQESAEPEEPLLEEPAYLIFDDRFVTTYQTTQGERFIAIEIQAMAHRQSALDKLEKHMPMVRNKLILLYSDQDYFALASASNKEQLRQDTLVAINEVLPGKYKIEEVFFTSFLMQ